MSTGHETSHDEDGTTRLCVPRPATVLAVGLLNMQPSAYQSEAVLAVHLLTASAAQEKKLSANTVRADTILSFLIISDGEPWSHRAPSASFLFGKSAWSDLI